MPDALPKLVQESDGSKRKIRAVTTSAAIFSSAFQVAFSAETSSSPFNEVDQFRAMMRAFASLRPKFYLEEFHGFKRQVYFYTVHPWMRKRARCELCDVLFVTYAKNGTLSVRMSLLQAKLSRSSHARVSSVYAGKIEPQALSGDFEQLDLLSRRPRLDPTTVFMPPPDLLSSAALSSVGSFGIFFKNGGRGIDLFYAVADCICPDPAPKGPDARLGKLRTVSGPAQRQINGWTETTYCPSASDFARALFQLEIGTPILELSSGGARSENGPQLDWVRSVIASHLAESDDNAPTTRALLADIGGADPLPKGAAIPTLMVLRGEEAKVEVDDLDV